MKIIPHLILFLITKYWNNIITLGIMTTCLPSNLRGTVALFSKSWFPQDGKSPPYWFQARDEKHYSVIHALSVELMPTVHLLLAMLSTHLGESIDQLLREEWPTVDMFTLAVLLDQMPRNALAIGYGGQTAQTVVASDAVTLRFTTALLERIEIPVNCDCRIVCFVSLVFRHSNQFLQARQILSTLRRDPSSIEDAGLPTLATKFWFETSKREKSVMNSSTI